MRPRHQYWTGLAVAAYLASHIWDELPEVDNLTIDVDHMSPVALGHDGSPTSGGRGR